MPNLPAPVAAYFASKTEADFDAIFADKAVVKDEAKMHCGLAAIRKWRADTMARTPFVARPLAVESRADCIVVPAEVSGTFPGSPLTLEHRFTLQEGRIIELEIQ